MSKPHFLLAVALLLIISHTKADSLACRTNIGTTYYDLSPMASNNGYDITPIDEANKIYMKFNLCRFNTVQCRGRPAFAALFSSDTATNDCIDVSATTKFNYITTDLINANKKNAGLRMLFENGDPISNKIGTWSPFSADVIAANPQATYSFQVNFHCNNSAEAVWFAGWQLVPANWTYIVDVHSTDACALITFDQVSQFIGDYPIPFTIVGSVLGFLIMILGLKLFLPTIALFGFGAGFLVTMFTFFGSVITPDSRESTKWILLAFSIIFGLALAYIVVVVNKIGVFLMGAWFGFVLALILYNAVLYKINSNPDLVLLLSCGIGALVFGIVSLIFYKHVVIISTSLVGSYLLVRSLSLVIGGFPNEIKLVQQIQDQDYAFTVSWTFYVYMNVILVLMVLSIIIQYKIKKYSDKKAEEFSDDDFMKLDI